MKIHLRNMNKNLRAKLENSFKTLPKVRQIHGKSVTIYI